MSNLLKLPSAELAERLGVSRRTAQRYIKAGKLPEHRATSHKTQAKRPKAREVEAARLEREILRESQVPSNSADLLRLPTKTIAKLLGVSQRTAQRYVAQGIPRNSKGAAWLIEPGRAKMRRPRPKVSDVETRTTRTGRDIHRLTSDLGRKGVPLSKEGFSFGAASLLTNLSQLPRGPNVRYRVSVEVTMRDVDLSDIFDQLAVGSGSEKDKNAALAGEHLGSKGGSVPIYAPYYSSPDLAVAAMFEDIDGLREFDGDLTFLSIEASEF